MVVAALFRVSFRVTVAAGIAAAAAAAAAAATFGAVFVRILCLGLFLLLVLVLFLELFGRFPGGYHPGKVIVFGDEVVRLVAHSKSLLRARHDRFGNRILALHRIQRVHQMVKADLFVLLERLCLFEILLVVDTIRIEVVSAP